MIDKQSQMASTPHFIPVFGRVPFNAAKVSKRLLDQSERRNLCFIYLDCPIKLFEFFVASNGTQF